MIKRFKNIEYIIKTPKKTQAKNPVLLDIHGAGGRGNNIDLLNNNSILRYRELNGQNFPFVTVLPQCRYDSWFDIFEQLQEFINFIVNESYADPNRIYLTGASMGGYTAYQLLMSMPNTFAAAAICCGGGMYWNAGRINAPLRIYHGKDDETVFVDESIKMHTALIKAGKKAELFLFDNADHNCWDLAYTDQNTYDFLLSKTL